MDDLTKPPNLIQLATRKGRAGRRNAGLVRAEKIEEAEQDLYSQSLSVLRDASYFGQLDPENPPTQPPREWVKEMGIEAATERLRICRMALCSAKEAPVGLGLAKYVVGAFAKARADAKRPPSLNVQVIQMIGGPTVFPEVEIVEGGDKT